MLSLVRSRGFVGLVQDDPAVLWVAIGAVAPTPVWCGRDRPRLLVEAASADWHGAASARAFGFDVMVCPMAVSREHSRCPVLRGQRCPLADGADAIVSTLPRDDAVTGILLRSHDERRPPPLVCYHGASAVPDPGRRLDVAEDDPDTAPRILEALGLPASLPHRDHPVLRATGVASGARPGARRDV
jgi:hypothetical protein